MQKTKLSLFMKMLKIRKFEEKVVALYPEQEMRCPVHLSIGQEATAAGMCEALSVHDFVFSNHRSHGHFIAKGGSLKSLAAELYGKATGCCGGVGGSMHLIDLSVGYVASTPIVGSMIPIAVGSAMSNQMRGSAILTVVFLGDAAVEEGVFHESVNFALVRKIPIVFFCENNFYSVYTPLGVRQPHRPIAQLAQGHGIQVISADGNDAYDVYQAAQAAHDYVQSGKGPVFISAETYRWREHCGPNYDNDLGYRTEAEFLQWRAKCPIERLKKDLLEKEGISGKELTRMGTQVDEEIETAFNFAKKSPFPEKERLFKNLYSSLLEPASKKAVEKRIQ